MLMLHARLPALKSHIQSCIAVFDTLFIYTRLCGPKGTSTCSSLALQRSVSVPSSHMFLSLLLIHQRFVLDTSNWGVKRYAHLEAATTSSMT